jgi:excisionase family DNA binding protein
MTTAPPPNAADDDSPTNVFVRPAARNPEDTGAVLAHLPPVLTTREAATALRIGVKEVRKLVDAGDLPAARFGPRRVIRIAKSALVRVLRGRAGQRR